MWCWLIRVGGNLEHPLWGSMSAPPDNNPPTIYWICLPLLQVFRRALMTCAGDPRPWVVECHVGQNLTGFLRAKGLRRHMETQNCDVSCSLYVTFLIAMMKFQLY